MSGLSVMDELFRYVGFEPADAERLTRAGPLLAPHFEGIVDSFYEAIERHPNARAVFVGGHAQIERQKVRLREWLAGIFAGVYDEAYYERRARIGRVHVQIDLDQRYMFGAMNLIRSGLHEALDTTPLAEKSPTHRSLDRICDVELAIMLETYRERYVERQRAVERLATIGQVSASIGHELRNPLAVMETSLHLVRRRIDDEKASRHIERIGEQIALCGSIIGGLLDLARDRPPERQLVHLKELVTAAAAAARVSPPVQVVVDIDAELSPIWVDHAQMRQVVANLIVNASQAIEALGRPGVVTVRAGLDGDRAWIEVRDDGPGFKPEVLDRAFEPLVTSRQTGIGLGLALCARIVERHGGSIEAQNLPERGALVRVVLPRAREHG